MAIVEEEAELVRSTYRRYLDLGSVNELLRDLKERNIRTKSRLLSTGVTRGGIPFGRGALYYALAQWSHRTIVRNKSDDLLTGLLFDDAGHRMIPTHTTKAGVRYRYYASTPVLHGEAKTASAGSVSRIPTAAVEGRLPRGVGIERLRDPPTEWRRQFEALGLIPE